MRLQIYTFFFALSRVFKKKLRDMKLKKKT